MKTEQVCAAHSLLVDNVRYIRRKQDETSEKVQTIAEGQTTLTLSVTAIKETQDQMMKLLKRKRWTPAKMTFFVASIFGSGNAFPKLLSILITHVGGK